MVTIEQIKELRDRTGISISQCKKALEEAGGDTTKALELLKTRGAEIANKKSDRTLGSSIISSYIHSTGKLGALIELSSETDFVSKNADFKILADDLAMHIAACDPRDNDELMAQPYVKDPSLTVTDLIKNHIQKFGERIELVRYVRYSA